MSDGAWVTDMNSGYTVLDGIGDVIEQEEQAKQRKLNDQYEARRRMIRQQAKARAAAKKTRGRRGGGAK